MSLLLRTLLVNGVGTYEIYVFVDDNMWEDFKKATKDLFVLDDTGLKAIIQRDYIFLDFDPDEDFNL